MLRITRSLENFILFILEDYRENNKAKNIEKDISITNVTFNQILRSRTLPRKKEVLKKVLRFCNLYRRRHTEKDENLLRFFQLSLRDSDIDNILNKTKKENKT